MSLSLLTSLYAAIMQATREYADSKIRGDKPEEIMDSLGYFSGLIRAANALKVLNDDQAYDLDLKIRGCSHISHRVVADFSNQLYAIMFSNS